MGWLKTADDYFTGYNPNQVNTAVMIIIDTVVQSLKRDPNRRFCYAEVGFLTRWLETRSQEEIQDLKDLVNKGKYYSKDTQMNFLSFRTTRTNRWRLGPTR